MGKMLYDISGFQENDIVGCGVDFFKKEVFWTLNGTRIPATLLVDQIAILYPAVAIRGVGNKARAIFNMRHTMFNINDYNYRLREEICQAIQNLVIEKNKAERIVHDYLYTNGFSKTLVSFENDRDLPRINMKRTRPISKAVAINSHLYDESKVPAPNKQIFIGLRKMLGLSQSQTHSQSSSQSEPKPALKNKALEYSDRTAFEERGTIHRSIISGKSKDAEHILLVFFPELLNKSQNMKLILKVLGFLDIFSIDQHRALIYTRENLTGSVRTQEFSVYNNEGIIKRMQVKVCTLSKN